MHVFLHATMPAQLATHRPTIEINVPHPAPASQPASSQPANQPTSPSQPSQPTQPASPPAHQATCIRGEGVFPSPVLESNVEWWDWGVGLRVIIWCLLLNLGMSCKFDGGLRPSFFIMRSGIGLECYHLMLVLGIWASLINLKVACDHLLL